MHSYIIFAAVLLPLIGVWNMESGAFGFSIRKWGYPNGSLAAFSMYALVLLACYAAFRRRQAFPQYQNPECQIQYEAYARALLLLLLVVLLVMLVGFGGRDVWSGAMSKGEFRVHLGSFGSVAYFLINNVVPFSLALAALLYRRLPKTIGNTSLLAALAVVTLLIGSTWGFKSTGITMMVPALLVLFWSASFLTVMKIGFAGALVIVVLFAFFDRGTTEAEWGLSFLLTRLTTIQGDVPWYVWGRHAAGVEFPSYFRTFLVFVGDTVFTAVTGIGRGDSEQWALYHFDVLVGTLAGLPASVMGEGHSIVGTPFVDGLVLGGLPGVLLIGALAGVAAAWLCNMLEQALRSGQDYRAALIATYFGIYFVTFLRNGVAVQLFHVASIVGLLGALVMCAGIHRLVLRHLGSDSQPSSAGID